MLWVIGFDGPFVFRGSSPEAPSRSTCLLPASEPQLTLLCARRRRVWQSYSISRRSSLLSVLIGGLCHLDPQASGRLCDNPFAADGVALCSIPNKHETQLHKTKTSERKGKRKEGEKEEYVFSLSPPLLKPTSTYIYLFVFRGFFERDSLFVTSTRYSQCPGSLS